MYSEYDVISRRRVMQDRYAFYCGAAKVREGKNLPAGGVVQLKSLGQLEEFFEPQGAGKEFCRVCRMLLNVGVSGVYAVPLTVDGSRRARCASCAKSNEVGSSCATAQIRRFCTS